MLLPPFATNIVRAAFQNWRHAYSENDLHPFAIALINDLSAGRDSIFTFNSPQKNAFTISFTDVNKHDADLKIGVALSINDTDVFRGSARLRGILRMGRVTMAHAVVGLTELLYDELMYAVSASDETVEAAIGLMRLEGQVINPNLITTAVAPLYDRPRRDVEPGFDYSLIYGFYPMLGFEHFYGGDFKIIE